jgi:Flp pilus assembly protein TadD
MSQSDLAEMTRRARRWADVAWGQGWYRHAIEVLDCAVELDPGSFKLYRKRGAFYLLCPDPTIRDEEQAFADLRKACELTNWRGEVVRWVAALLARNGDVSQAKTFMRELSKRQRAAREDRS